MPSGRLAAPPRLPAAGPSPGCRRRSRLAAPTRMRASLSPNRLSSRENQSPCGPGHVVAANVRRRRRRRQLTAGCCAGRGSSSAPGEARWSSGAGSGASRRREAAGPSCRSRAARWGVAVHCYERWEVKHAPWRRRQPLQAPRPLNGVPTGRVGGLTVRGRCAIACQRENGVLQGLGGIRGPDADLDHNAREDRRHSRRSPAPRLPIARSSSRHRARAARSSGPHTSPRPPAKPGTLTQQ